MELRQLALAAMVCWRRRGRRALRTRTATRRAEPAAAANPPGGDPCIDEDVKADLFAKRQPAHSRDRLFQQTNRHELSMQGGYYVVRHLRRRRTSSGAVWRSDPHVRRLQRSRTRYHMTEDLAVEATAAVTQLASRGGPELERTFAVLQGRTRTQLLFDADLVWAPAHAKLGLGGSITHFDLYSPPGPASSIPRCPAASPATAASA